jgi:hypothetical protein
VPRATEAAAKTHAATLAVDIPAAAATAGAGIVAVGAVCYGIRSASIVLMLFVQREQ